MSRSLRWSCCALGCLVIVALESWDSTAHGERLAFRKSRPAMSDANFGQMPPDCGMPYDAGRDPQMDWGPVDGAGCGDYGCGCDAYAGDCGSCGCDYDTCGCEPGCEMYCECEPNLCCNPRYVMFADFLYLQATGVDVAHAQQQNGIGGAGTVPFGDIGTVEHEFSPGFRVGGAVACSPCSGVVFSFTHFESDAFNSIEAPNIPGGGGAVGSLVHHPGAALTASAGPVDATYEIDYQLADVMCRTVWRCGPGYAVDYMVGGQFGHLDQDFDQIGIFGGGQSGAVDTSTTIDFDGGGLKGGLDAERQFANGLGFYGKLTAAVMSGRFSSRYTMFNESTDQLLAQANWKDDRLVGHIEYEIGMSITSKDTHWRATAGYKFSHWMNAVTTPEFIDAVQADNYTDLGDTLSFDGLVTRVECRW